MSGAISVNGILATHARILVPWCGVWSAEVTFAEPSRLTGPVTLMVDSAPFLGVVADEQSGQFANRGTLTIVGGRGGWRRNLGAAHEHNDGALTRSRIATKTALECGETLAVDPTADGPIGSDFVRPVGAAHRVLDQLFPSVPWSIDPTTGATRVGEPLPLDVSTLVQALQAHPGARRVELVTDDVRNAMPGCFIVDPRFESTEPFTIRDVEIEIGDRFRIHVTGGDARASTTIALLTQIVEVAQPRAMLAFAYRYRVVSVGVDGRLMLQAVSMSAGVPDLRFVRVIPGLAGSSSVHTPGAIVLVSFIEGDPGQPVVTGLAPEQDEAFVPLSTKIDATMKVEIGGSVPRASVAAFVGRFMRWGDYMVHPVTGLPLAMIPHPGGVSLANVGTTVLP